MSKADLDRFNDFMVEYKKEVTKDYEEEIERLNKELDYYKKEKELYRYYQQEVPRLSNIINKAIEYIESEKIFNDIEVARIIVRYEKALLDILRGEEK